MRVAHRPFRPLIFGCLLPVTEATGCSTFPSGKETIDRVKGALLLVTQFLERVSFLILLFLKEGSF